MTIDERLYRLTERHEALAQSLELLTSLHRDTEERLAKFITNTDERMGKLIDAMTSLARVVEDHQRRIDGLEQR